MRLPWDIEDSVNTLKNSAYKEHRGVNERLWGVCLPMENCKAFNEENWRRWEVEQPEWFDDEFKELAGRSCYRLTCRGSCFRLIKFAGFSSLGGGVKFSEAC